MRKLLTFSLILLLAGCGSQEKTKSSVTLKNYAAVWQLTTEDYDHLMELLPKQQDHLFDYYNKGIIENIYFEKGEETGETYSIGSISFVVRATDKENARAILDAMPFAQSKISSYQLFPLGVKWLTRTDEHKKIAAEAKQSFVVVWITTGTDEEMDAGAKEQVDETLDLYKRGIIENAYLETEVIAGAKEGYPIIYFINAKDVKSAKEILDNTLYVKMNLATYELRPVGNFWLGNIKDQK